MTLWLAGLSDLIHNSILWCRYICLTLAGKSKPLILAMKRSISVRRWLQLSVAASSILAACAFVSCDRVPDKEQVAAPETPGVSAAVEKIEGGALNQFFPKDQGDFDVIFKAEKDGYAEAKLENGDDELGTLSVSDTAGDPGVINKYNSSTMKIAGYPAVTRGSNGTAVLAGRFQVQVRSKSDSFSAADREQWLQKFDLTGLANLAK